jgi:DNA polymerase-3 subunit epsilon
VNWREATLFAVDTETTGVDHERDRIVELGACRYVPAAMVDYDEDSFCRFGTLLNPGMPIPPEATAINGITDEMVGGKPRIEDIAERFLARVEAADVLVGYNWPFDERMLRAELGKDWEVAIYNKPVIDVYRLVKLPQVGKFWPGEKKGNPGRHRLGNVAARSDISIQRRGKAHRASSDAELALRLLLRLSDPGTHYGSKLAKYIPDDAHEFSRRIEGWREEQEADFQAWRATQPERASA